MAAALGNDKFRRMTCATVFSAYNSECGRAAAQIVRDHKDDLDFVKEWERGASSDTLMQVAAMHGFTDVCMWLFVYETEPPTLRKFVEGAVRATSDHDALATIATVQGWFSFGATIRETMRGRMSGDELMCIVAFGAAREGRVDACVRAVLYISAESRDSAAYTILLGAVLCDSAEVPPVLAFVRDLGRALTRDGFLAFAAGPTTSFERCGLKECVHRAVHSSAAIELNAAVKNGAAEKTWDAYRPLDGKRIERPARDRARARSDSVGHGAGSGSVADLAAMARGLSALRVEDMP